MYRIVNYKNREALNIMLSKTKKGLAKKGIHPYTFKEFYAKYKTTIDTYNIVEGCFVVAYDNVEDFGLDVCTKITDIKPNTNASCTLRFDTVELRGRVVMFSSEEAIYNFDDVLIFEFLDFTAKMNGSPFVVEHLQSTLEAVNTHYKIISYRPQRTILEYLNPLLSNPAQLQHVKNLLDDYTQNIIDLTSEGLEADIQRLELQVIELQKTNIGNSFSLLELLRAKIPCGCFVRLTTNEGVCGWFEVLKVITSSNAQNFAIYYYFYHNRKKLIRVQNDILFTDLLEISYTKPQ